MIDGDAGVRVGGQPGAKPRIDLPDAAPPGQLHAYDVTEGAGPPAPPGSRVTTHYVGVSWSSGQQFDASWDRGEPIAFGLDQVISGWTQGIPGMRVGGRRLLVVPPTLAYGRRPPPGAGIAPDETLVFVVDLLTAAEVRPT